MEVQKQMKNLKTITTKVKWNFLSYNEYLNDEEIQANIKALNLDVDKFLFTYTVHYPCFQRTVEENPYMAHVYPHTQVESFVKLL